jgi:tetratricopeptide (TPR) repeat protein
LTETRREVERLIAEHGQDEFELALARWYFEGARVDDHYKNLEQAETRYTQAEAFFGGAFNYRGLADVREGVAAAIRLGSVLLRRHRFPEARMWYRKAFDVLPRDPNLAEEVAHVLLRHGSDREIRDFLDRLAREQPNLALTQYATTIYAAFDRYVAEVKTRTAGAVPPDKPTAIIVLPLWGQRYVDTFLRYALPNLMTDGNLPDVARRYSTTLVLFGSCHAIEAVQGDANFGELCRVARFEPIELEEPLLRHADQQLAQYLLLSLAHYATLEAARQLDTTVFFAFPDNIVNGSFYSNACERLARGATAVACTGFRLDMGDVLSAIEEHRDEGGKGMSGAAVAALVMRHLGEQWFVDSQQFAVSPFFLCWRVGDEGLLVRSTHFQPYAIRAKALNKPLSLKVDPVDAQFMWRNFGDLDGIDCVADTEMCCFDIGVAPNLDPGGAKTANTFREQDLARFLPVYDTPLHRRFLRTPIRLNVGPMSPEWDHVENAGDAVMERVFATMDGFEAKGTPRPTWALEDDREFLVHG